MPRARDNRAGALPLCDRFHRQPHARHGDRQRRHVRDQLHTYDPLNRLTAADYSTGESFAYAYDAVGNRTAMTDTAGVITYTYDAANRLTEIQHPDASIETYTWDARGNLIGDGAFTYDYNAAGRMVRADSATDAIIYGYNADGLRVTKEAKSGPSVAYTWDWATGVPEMLSDGDALYLVGHETLGQFADDVWTYHLPDALGSVRQATDATGAVTAAREWTPYGVEMGDAQPGLGYTGEWFDAEVEAQYLRARWYDVATGRFTSRDPWEGDPLRPISLLPYPYASDNPVNRTDPSGEIDELIWRLAIAGYVPGSGMWCSTNPDYQPFERLNIYLGHEDVDQVYSVNRGETVQKWNTVDPIMLRALNRAIRGMELLIGPAFGQHMGNALGNKVVVVYDPPGLPNRKLNYNYEASWAGIRVGANRLQVDTASGDFLNLARQFSLENRMTASFAHELTHLVVHIVNQAPPNKTQPIYVEYCDQVRGFIRRNDGKWGRYPVSSVSVDGTMSVCCGDCDPQVGCNDAYNANPWEALANSVGVYVAAPTVYDNRLHVSFDDRLNPLDLSHVRDFVENDFVVHVQ